METGFRPSDVGGAASRRTASNNGIADCLIGGQDGAMACVDHNDDSVRRFIVRHYAYDPGRHERRHILVAAYDNEPEFKEQIDRRSRELKNRRERGESVDPREHISGTCLEPGEAHRRAAVRLVMAAIRHGVAPPEAALEQARSAAGFSWARFERLDPGVAHNP
jgi:hypothetical protein